MGFQNREISGFRALTSSELTSVCGGFSDVPPPGEEDEIVVNGVLPLSNPLSPHREFFGLSSDSLALATLALIPELQEAPGDIEDEQNANPITDDLTEEQQETTEIIVEGLIATLAENIERYGDAKINFPDGTSILASDALKSLGKALDFIEAGTLIAEALSGNPDVIAAAAFVAGIAGGAVAAALGAGPLAIFAASTIASIATAEGLTYIANTLASAWAAAYASYQQTVEDNTNPNYLPSENLLIFLQSLFGSPNVYDRDANGFPL